MDSVDSFRSNCPAGDRPHGFVLIEAPQHKGLRFGAIELIDTQTENRVFMPYIVKDDPIRSISYGLGVTCGTKKNDFVLGAMVYKQRIPSLFIDRKASETRAVIIEPTDPPYWGERERTCFSIFHTIIVQVFRQRDELPTRTYRGFRLEPQVINKLTRYFGMSMTKMVGNFHSLIMERKKSQKQPE